jgi:hypothetical protein
MKKRFFLLNRVEKEEEETIMQLGKPYRSALGALWSEV